MALGFQTVTSASISTATTTDLITVGNAFERIWVYWIGVDVQTAWTVTPTVDIRDNGSSPIRVGTFSTLAQGHQEAYPTMVDRNFMGLGLNVGQKLQAVTTGTPGALTITIMYEIRGGA